MEINGFGIVEQRGADLVIVDVMITKQRATEDMVVADAADLCRLLHELTARGVQAEQIACQWHSHVNWPVVFSKRDIVQINRWSGGYLISIVVNKHGDMSCRLDCYKPLRMAFEVLLELELELPDAECLLQCKKDIVDNVTIITRKKKKWRAPWTS